MALLRMAPKAARLWYLLRWPGTHRSVYNIPNPKISIGWRQQGRIGGSQGNQDHLPESRVDTDGM